MSAHLESFKKFLKEREKASQAYVSGNGEPFVKVSATKSPATFFSPDGDFVEDTKKVAARYKKDAEIFESANENKFQTLQISADENIAFWVGLQKSVVRMKENERQKTADSDDSTRDRDFSPRSGKLENDSPSCRFLEDGSDKII